MYHKHNNSSNSATYQTTVLFTNKPTYPNTQSF